MDQFLVRGETAANYQHERWSSRLTKRVLNKEFKGSTNYYGMSLTKGEVIDARACGGIARFANHGCNPNCVVERWEGS
ncbi:hypothetical protein PPTG_24251 [Phytophthora nicotianae INRA-310]|uniref:SET domain-containing protein n=2 Tax=Phytophthora nicotianae TaxID=4792 RepID=W2PKI4_PHYN3|nr:hypothetical protein PPTG_24251 [Phytophthora nicotianae INRA-310]ETN00550.1 hypothetical protein PPTG_24251 [Phytophthora nicotianae INRA-310]